MAAFLVVLVLATAPTEQWAGHQVVWGTAEIPLLGERVTRTDSYVLTHVLHIPGGMRLTQRTCRVEIAPVAGVRTYIPARAYPHLPVVPFTLIAQEDSSFSGTWQAEWTHEDHDRDGAPGVTVHVDVPMCRGRVYVASRSVTEASANFVGQNLEGEVTVRFSQEVVGASNACLRLAAANTSDTMHGVIRYRPVSYEETCDSIAEDAWPQVD